MFLRDWGKLPDYMKNSEVKVYYNSLKRKSFSIFIKRLFDIAASLVLIVLLSPLLLILAIAVKADSPGSIFFTQDRVTQYGRIFKMFKFRSMVQNAPDIGPSVTVEGDARITRVGKFMRKFRLDEIPQLFNILMGDLTFVGIRPEVKKYVSHYTEEMTATLLLPAGVTSMTSIAYRNEDQFLKGQGNTDNAYIKVLLPAKMQLNLEYLKKFSLLYDLKVIFLTIFVVFVRNKS